MATDATGTPTSLGIPKYNVNVDDPTGNGFNATMDVINALLLSQPNKTLTQNDKLALQLTGASAGLTIGGDTNLYRNAAGDLRTDGKLLAMNSANGGIWTQLSGQAGGGININGDTNLYRFASNVLKTDGQMLAGTNFVAGGSGSGFLITGPAGMASGTFGLLLSNNTAASLSTSPNSGGFLFSDLGALKYKGSSGTVTTIAPA